MVSWGVNHDITEQKRGEDALRESEERFRALTENVPDLIRRFDRNLKLIYCEPGCHTANRTLKRGTRRPERDRVRGIADSSSRLGEDRSRGARLWQATKVRTEAINDREGDGKPMTPCSDPEKWITGKIVSMLSGVR
jgi:PAS domain-containing protein